MAIRPVIDGFCMAGDVRSTTPYWNQLPSSLQVYLPDSSTGFDLYMSSNNLVGSADPKDLNWVGKYDPKHFGSKWTKDARNLLKNLEFDYHAPGDCLYARNLNYVPKPGKVDEEVFLPHGVRKENWQIAEFVLAQLRTRQLVASITWVQLDARQAEGEELIKFQGSEEFLGDYNTDDEGQEIPQNINRKYRTAYTWPGC